MIRSQRSNTENEAIVDLDLGHTSGQHSGAVAVEKNRARGLYCENES
jgi:hypothetical protein